MNRVNNEKGIITNKRPWKISMIVLFVKLRPKVNKCLLYLNLSVRIDDIKTAKNKEKVKL